MLKKNITEVPPPESASPPEKTEGFWSSSAKSIVPLLALVIGIKMFVADIYAIPSGSMEPTLHGRAYSGDRIFCSKVDFYWRDPRRWEVFVFKFPYEESREYTTEDTSHYKGEYFIKRCVGLPGEDVYMARGDIFTQREGNPPTAKRQVKDDDRQRDLWLPVYAEDFHDLTVADFAHYWDFSGAAELTITPQKKLLARASAAAPITFTFRPQTRTQILTGVPDRYFRRQYVIYQCPQCGKEKRQTVTRPQFTDRCASCQTYLTETDVTYYDFRIDYPQREMARVTAHSQVSDETPRAADWNFVPDLRLQTRGSFLETNSTLTLEITNDLHTAAAAFTVKEAEVGEIKLTVDNREIDIPRPAIRLLLGQPQTIEFYLCDGEYRAFIDGKPLFAVAPFGQDLDETAVRGVTRSGVNFSVTGAAEFTEITVDRDIYYYSTQNPNYVLRPYHVPEKGFLALGDNCPSSNDSRNWGPVPQKNLVGPARAVWWPPHAVGLIP